MAMFIEILKYKPLINIEKAFIIWVKESSKIPTPSDIFKIVETKVKVEIKNKPEQGYAKPRLKSPDVDANRVPWSKKTWGVFTEKDKENLRHHLKKIKVDEVGTYKKNLMSMHNVPSTFFYRTIITMTNKPENTGRKQDGTFKKGVSGNPDGKPRGTRHKATQAALTLLDGETEALARKAIELALNGDVMALRLCLERVAPALKSTAPLLSLDMPKPDNLTDTAKAFLHGAANGKIPPDIAASLISAVSSTARVQEHEHIKERLQALERAIKEKNP